MEKGNNGRREGGEDKSYWRCPGSVKSGKKKKGAKCAEARRAENNAPGDKGALLGPTGKTRCGQRGMKNRLSPGQSRNLQKKGGSWEKKETRNEKGEASH